MTIKNHEDYLDRPILRESWRFRLGMFLLNHDIPLATLIIVLIWVGFAILAPLVWRACR